MSTSASRLAVLPAGLPGKGKGGKFCTRDGQVLHTRAICLYISFKQKAGGVWSGQNTG